MVNVFVRYNPDRGETYEYALSVATKIKSSGVEEPVYVIDVDGETG